MKKLQLIKNAKKIVIKIGSSLLIDNGKFNYKWLRSFVEDLDSLLNKTQIIILKRNVYKTGNCTYWCNKLISKTKYFNHDLITNNQRKTSTFYCCWNH